MKALRKSNMPWKEEVHPKKEYLSTKCRDKKKNKRERDRIKAIGPKKKNSSFLD
jgi:hypothetical protein